MNDPGLPDYSGYLHVAAAVIEDHDGRILLARRPVHLHQGGLWEFPGGKVEPGEDVRIALERELAEELGIKVTRAVPLIRIPYEYPDRRVLLDVWRVTAFENTPHGAEGQTIRWVEPAELRDYDFPAANSPIIAAAILPERYLITPEPGGRERWPAFLTQLEGLMASGLRLIQFRAKGLVEKDFRALAQQVLTLGRERGVTVLLNTSPELARELDADGLHLSTSHLRQLQQRPLADHKWLAASCHNLEELQLAMALNVDFVVISPVCPTTSHPGQKGMGWDAFHRLTERSSIPVYALGGMKESDVETALANGGQGIAAITALWQRATV